MLLSVRPDVYEKIKSGLKIFEHRRNFPDEPIMAYMYVSSPVKAITGVVYLGKRHCLSDWMEDYKEDSNAVTRIKEYIEKYHYRYAMEIDRFQETSQILLDDLRKNVPGFVAPQMYIYLDGTELLEYIESNLKMIDLQVERSFERIEACQVYATVQNKMHYAVHGNTAAEVIVARADHNKEHMGLKSWKNAPDGKIVKTDVSIAKNYLEKEELAELNEIVTMYLDYATRQARRHIPMTMEDWKTKLDAFLRFNDADVLQDKGKVTAAIAKEFAESEFERYRVIQDSLYESDFDKLMNDMEKNGITY